MSNGHPLATAKWEWLVEGYRRALARFTASADARDNPEERFIPLFETLNWVVAIMDHPGGKHLYGDEIVRGLRFARNSVHHDLADALEPRDVPFAPGLVVRAVGGRGSLPHRLCLIGSGSGRMNCHGWGARIPKGRRHMSGDWRASQWNAHSPISV